MFVAERSFQTNNFLVFKLPNDRICRPILLNTHLASILP